MGCDFPEMYEAYDGFKLEPDREELQRRDDVHLAKWEEWELRGMPIQAYIAKMYSCTLCGKLMVHPDSEKSGDVYYHPACLPPKETP